MYQHLTLATPKLNRHCFTWFFAPSGNPFRAGFLALALLFCASPAYADCLAKPDLRNHSGYWRYHVIRRTGEHCWYLSQTGRKAAPARRADKPVSARAAGPAPIRRLPLEPVTAPLVQATFMQIGYSAEPVAPEPTVSAPVVQVERKPLAPIPQPNLLPQMMTVPIAAIGFAGLIVCMIGWIGSTRPLPMEAWR